MGLKSLVEGFKEANPNQIVHIARMALEFDIYYIIHSPKLKIWGSFKNKVLIKGIGLSKSF